MPSLLHRLSHLKSRSRLLLALAAGLLGGALAAWLQPASGPEPKGEVPWLVGWCVFCTVLLASHVYLMATLDAEGMRRRALREDPGGPMIAVLVIAAACTSLVAIAQAVATGQSLEGLERWMHVALALASLVLSWLMMHLAYALHYAREYYQPDEDRPSAAPPDAQEAPAHRTADAVPGMPDPAGGLDFPGDEPPDYLDFAYFSAVIGMTSQVSDVEVTSRDMRRLTLVHSLLSFAFNLIVLALAVNVLASLLQGN